MGERVWAMGERVVVVFAMAAVGFVALAVTGTLPLPAPSPAGATQYCTQYQPQYQYNVCGPLVPPLIAFQSNRDGLLNPELYAMNADGSTQVRLFSNTNAVEGTPAWAPNGQKLAFSSSRDGNTEVYVMNVDANGQTRLTFNAATDTFPSWSPDAGKIAFESNRDGLTNFEIYLMNPDGSAQTRLTNSPTFDGLPTWSPDAQKIAFTSGRDGNNEIYAMNADGTGQTRLTNNAASDNTAAWSPDGTRIAFTSNRDGNVEIYVMNADGTGLTRLTNDSGLDNTPTWSPDGHKIAFSSTRDGTSKIYSMNADGSGVTKLTNNTAADTSPNWQRTPPGPPLFITAVAGDHQATVTFDPPELNGGAAVSAYTVTTHPGNAHWSGPSSPIVAGALTNGTSYTFTVTATNGAGTGPDSTPSNAVVPHGGGGTPVKIAIAPDATNEVGQPHTFTVTLQKDVGNGFVAAPGEHVAVALTDSNGAGHTAPIGTCTGAGANTDAKGQCTITFSSATPGKVRGHASSTVTVGGTPFTVETDGVAPNSGDAVKTFVDANIQLAPLSATNAVGATHVLTAHVNVNTGAGSGFVNAPDGTPIFFVIDGGPGSFSSVNPCTTTGGTGSCQVTLSSATTGTTVVHAYVTLAVGGLTVSRNTNGVGANSATATKRWVNAKIAIAPDATNEVGQPHTFTVTLQKDVGGGFVPAAGEHVAVALTDLGGATHTAPSGTCTDAGANTDASGQCTITFSSPTAGKVRAHASSTLSVGGVPFTVQTDGTAGNSGDATKTFVDANIQLAPLSAAKAVGSSNVLTAQVNVNRGDGAGYVGAQDGTQVFFTIDSGPGSFTTTNPCTTAGGTGSCQITLTSASVGTTVVKAHVTLSVGGLTVARSTDGTGGSSGPASTTWADQDAPVLNLPGDISVDANSPGGAVVEYTVTATDTIDPAPVVVCTPASGTLFAAGDTPVSCTATDASGNISSGGFIVHVSGAAEQIDDLDVVLAGLNLDSKLDNDLQGKLDKAAASLAQPPKACQQLVEFVAKVFDEAGKSKSSLTLEGADELLAATTVEQALGCLPADSPIPAAEHETLDLIGLIDGMGLTAAEENDLRTMAAAVGNSLAHNDINQADKRLNDLSARIAKDAGKKNKLTVAQAAELQAAVAAIQAELA